MSAEGDAQMWRVLNGILGDIRSGRLPSGAALSTEVKMAERWQVSRATISRVMFLLRWTGVVDGPRGRPAKVSQEPMRRQALALFDSAEAIRALNAKIDASE